MPGRWHFPPGHPRRKGDETLQRALRAFLLFLAGLALSIGLFTALATP